MNEKRLYRIPELESILGLSKVTLREYFKKGKIKARKMGRSWVVSAKNLDEYSNGVTNRPATAGAMRCPSTSRKERCAMMVYFHNGKEEGHIMAAAEPSANDVAAINTPPFVIDFNAYVWAIDEAVERGLFK